MFNTNVDDMGMAGRFRELRWQKELDAAFLNPDVKSNIDFIWGVLFTNKMSALYVDESDDYKKLDENNFKEEQEFEEWSLSEDIDKFYSKLGIEFLKQYFKFSMIFWFYDKGNPQKEPRPHVPDPNGVIKIMIDKDLKTIPGWFMKNGNLIESQVNQNVLFKVFDPPDTETQNFRSKLLPILSDLYTLKDLRYNAVDLEFRKRNPQYYLQNSQFLNAGEHTKRVMNYHLGLYRDNRDKEGICENETDFFQTSEPLIDYYRDLFMDKSLGTQQQNGCDESLLVPLRNEQYIKDNGIPQLMHSRNKTYDMYDPGHTKRVVKFGANVQPKILEQKPANIEFIKYFDDRVKEKINKVFGVFSLKNHDNTRLGSTFLVNTMNESINAIKALMEEMLTEALLPLMSSRNAVKNRLYIPGKRFIGFRITPRTIIQESVIIKLIDKYSERPDVINEILKKTSIDELLSLKELKEVLEKEREKFKQQFLQKSNEQEQDQDMQPQKEGGSRKRPRDDSKEALQNNAKRSRIYIDGLRYNRYLSRKYIMGDMPMIVGDNRHYLNGHKFRVLNTVFDQFKVLNIWDNSRCWNDDWVQEYADRNKKNEDILYCGLVDNQPFIVSEKNLKHRV